MDKDDLIHAVVFFGVIAFIVGLLVLAALRPMFEARAFNACTGGNATYFTALFTELRVENCNQ